MKFLLLILSFGFTLVSLGQNMSDKGFANKAEATNKIVNGQKEGKWLEYRYEIDEVNLTSDTNAPYYSLSTYKAGKPYGMVRFYYRSGKIEWEIPYDTNGMENGIEREYYESGKLMYERPYINDKRNGTLKRYYESGTIEMENQFTNDIMNGVLKRYSESGKLQSETTFKKGIEKKTIKYDENGNKIK